MRDGGIAGDRQIYGSRADPFVGERRAGDGHVIHFGDGGVCLCPSDKTLAFDWGGLQIKFASGIQRAGAPSLFAAKTPGSGLGPEARPPCRLTGSADRHCGNDNFLLPGSGVVEMYEKGPRRARN